MTKILGTVDAIITHDGSTVPKHIIEALLKQESLHPHNETVFLEALHFHLLTRDAESYRFVTIKDLKGKNLEGYSLWVLESYLAIWEQISATPKRLISCKPDRTGTETICEFEETGNDKIRKHHVKTYDRLLLIKNK